MALDCEKKVHRFQRSILATALATTAATLLTSTAEATRRYDPMSLKPGSQSITDHAGINAVDIYAEVITPNPANPPVLDLPYANFDSSGGGTNLLDFSAGESNIASTFRILFSTAGTSGGADVYQSVVNVNPLTALAGTPASGPGSNVLVIDESTYNFDPLDDADGFEADQFQTSTVSGPVRVRDIYFTVESNTEIGQNIFFNAAGGPSTSVPYVLGSTLGLVETDVIDGLAVFDAGTNGAFEAGTDVIVFSLTSGSPSNSGSGANIFVTDGNSIELWADYAALGLSQSDEVDALDVAIPEPAALALVAFAAIPMLRRRRA